MHPAYQAYTMLHCIPATHTNHQYYNHRHTRDTSWTTDATVYRVLAGVPECCGVWSASRPAGPECHATTKKGREPVWRRRDKRFIYPFIKISTHYITYIGRLYVHQNITY